MHRTFLILLLASRLAAQLSISPSNPVVVSGGTQVFSSSGASGTVTWTLLNGSVGSIDPSTGTYTAPAHIGVSQQWGGCQVLPNDHIYNFPIDSMPVDPNSAALITAIGPNGLAAGPPGDMGVNSVSASTPVVTRAFYYTPLNNGNYFFPARPDLKIESGADTTFMLGQDHHMISVARDTCTIQEIYSPYPTGLNLLCPLCNAQAGINYGALSYALPPVSTDAAGLELLPLIYKKSEILARSINHAGRFTIQGEFLSSAHRWPAQSSSGGTNCATCIWPMGTRVRLQSSFNIGSLSSPYAQALAAAWQKYGMIVSDIGPEWNYQIEAESYTAELGAAFSELYSRVSSMNFEVIDESSLMISPTSGLVRTALPAANSATIVATDQVGHTASMNVAIEGVTVGTDPNTLTIQAGAAPFQVPVWVNGSANKSLTWNLNGLGSLSSAGVYTAPSFVATIQSASIIAVSQADPAVSLTIPVTIIPSGTIRINSGDSTDYTDTLGNTWYGDINSSHEISHWAGSYYAQGSVWDTADNTQMLYFIGGAKDAVYRLHVPNGNYQVQFLTGEVATIPANARCTDYEAQGQIGLHNYDVVARTGMTQVGTWVTVPAQVTNGNLSLAARWATCPPPQHFQYWSVPGYNQTYSPLVGAFLVKADASPAHLTLDTNTILSTPLTLSQGVQFYAVGWYMPNSVTWSLSGPGSLDSNGLYTAPSSPASGQVVITATSTTDPSQTAKATLTLGGATLSGLISAKAGAGNARTWTLAITDLGPAGAVNTTIDSFQLTQTSGVSCTPIVNSRFPVAIGSIPVNGSNSGNVTVDFSTCAATAKFTASASFSANGGEATGSMKLFNQLR